MISYSTAFKGALVPFMCRLTPRCIRLQICRNGRLSPSSTIWRPGR